MHEPGGEANARSRAARRQYEDQVLAAIKQLTAGMRRVAALAPQIDRPGADPELRAIVVAECQSWRAILDRMPAEQPPVYRGVHARVVRWSAVVAELGDRQIAALASRDPADQHQVTLLAAEVGERYRDIMRAMEVLVRGDG
jgi:hypothetical protein